MKHSSQNHLHRTILLIVGGLLGVTLIGLATVFILKAVEPQKITTSTKDTTAQVLSAADIINRLKDPETINALSTTRYDITVGSDKNEGSVYFRPPGQTYTVSTPTKNTQTYTAKAPNQTSDVTAVQEQLTAFMSRLDLDKIDTPAQTTSSTSNILTYTNTLTACQLTSNKAPEDSEFLDFHTIACVDKAAIDKEYTAIQKLMNNNETTKQMNNLQQINRYVSAEGNKSYATLATVNTEGDSTLLLFAAVDNNWEYIGNLRDASDNKSAKYTISPEIEQAISDPKYGNFLLKNFQ